MPVAGGTVEVRLCRLQGDRLVDMGKSRSLSHMAFGVPESIARLRKGETVNVKFLGNNWEKVKQEFSEGSIGNSHTGVHIEP